MFDPITIHINGSQVPRKSNSRRIVRTRSGKPRSIKSKAALDWLAMAKFQVPLEARQQVGDKDHLLSVTFFVRYASRRPDLSVELLLDFLQTEGVIKDDRYVFAFHAHKEIAPNNPGVKIVIAPYIPGLFEFLHNLAQKALAWAIQHGQDGWF